MTIQYFLHFCSNKNKQTSKKNSPLLVVLEIQGWHAKMYEPFLTSKGVTGEGWKISEESVSSCPYYLNGPTVILNVVVFRCKR